jgi:Spy/CpxP family protein refolding chaperone
MLMQQGMGGDGGLQDALMGKILTNPKMAEKIGLSEDQINTLKSSAESMKKEQEELEKQLKNFGLEQAKLMTAKTVDEEALFSAIEKTGKIRTDLAKVRIKHTLLVKKTLTPEQLEKLKELVKEHAKKMRTEGEKGNALKGGVEKFKERREHMKKEPEGKKDQQGGEKPAGEV